MPAAPLAYPFVALSLQIASAGRRRSLRRTAPDAVEWEPATLRVLSEPLYGGYSQIVPSTIDANGTMSGVLYEYDVREICVHWLCCVSARLSVVLRSFKLSYC
jgi:hypothetical protein